MASTARLWRGAVIVAFVVLVAACSASGTDDTSTPASTATPNPTSTVAASTETPVEPSPTNSAANGGDPTPSLGTADTEPGTAIEICQTPGAGPGASFGGTSSAFEVLETYRPEAEDDWAGWVFDSSDGQQRFVVFVTARVEEHEAELRRRLDDDIGLTVEATDRSLAELEPLAETLRAILAPNEPFGPTVRVGVSRDRASRRPETQVWIRATRADEATRAEVADAADAAGQQDLALVCLAPRVGPSRPTGDQRQSGPGWRLLEETIDGPSQLSVASSPEAYRALVAEARAGTEVPEVDLDSEIVVYAGSGTGGCTDLYLTDVTIDPGTEGDGAAVTVVVDRPWCGGGPELAVFVPHGYLLAIERARLPERFELRLDNRRGATAAEPLLVDLGDRQAEVDRLGDPRLDITITPDTDDRTWMVDGDATGPTPKLLFRDVFEVLPDEIVEGMPEGTAEELMKPRTWSATVPVDTTGVTVTVRTCVDDVCTEPRTCRVDLSLASFDHRTVELELTADDGCRFGPVVDLVDLVDEQP